MPSPEELRTIRARLILVTGAAGFIGSHVARRLLDDGEEVVGLDNLDPYYDVSLKEARLDRLRSDPQFEFRRLDLTDRAGIDALFAELKPRRVIHLAAQAGVRYSLTNPHSYVDSNVTGFLNVLEAARHHPIEHLLFASTSSVYGANTKQPFSEHDPADHPLTLYAATKKANEMMAHSYAHLFGIPVTGLRFFTVYGPWGRPDMALFKFTRGILAGEPIPVFNRGEMTRDFTYVDDVVEGIVRIAAKPALANPDWDSNAPDPASSNVPFRIYNIGNSRPVPLMVYIRALEKSLGRTATLDLLPFQLGDVPSTQADVSELEEAVSFRPATAIEDGVARFVEWYTAFYGVK